MTVWNWISLIGFLVLPFTVANLWFNLSPRYKNWRATRSRKLFDKRIERLEHRLNMAAIQRSNPTNLFVDIAIDILRLLLFSVGYLAATFLFEKLAFLTVPSVCVFCFQSLLRARLKLVDFRHPELIGTEYINLVKKSFDRQLIDNAKPYYETLLNHRAFAEVEKELLALRVGKLN